MSERTRQATRIICTLVLFSVACSRAMDQVTTPGADAHWETLVFPDRSLPVPEGVVDRSSVAASEAPGTDATVDATAVHPDHAGLGDKGAPDKGASDQSASLYSGKHTATDCTGLSGTVVTDGSNAFCKLPAGTCPSGWTAYLSWSEKTCDCSFCLGSYYPCGDCRAHGWANADATTYYCNADCYGSGFCRNYQCTCALTHRGCY